MNRFMQKFILKNTDFIALCDLLKASGTCQTGGEAKSVIQNGEVKVDSEVEFRRRRKIKSGQIVEYASQLIQVSD
jgi:ribosome-associated protein